MTRGRSPRDGAGPREPRKGGPGILPPGLPVAAILSVVGLLVIGFFTLSIGSGAIPGLGTIGNPGTQPGATDNPAIQKTPSPPDIVIVQTPPPDLADPVLGSLVYAKDGNIWIQGDGTAQQLTKGGSDSMPTFAPDGKTVYFIRTRDMQGSWPIQGSIRTYQMAVPSLMQVKSTGGSATRVVDGLYDPPGTLRWMGFIRTPAVSPNGRYIAMATDMPDPNHSDVVLKLYDTRRDRIVDPQLGQVPPLGHQDPAWRPDGLRIAYVRNDRDGAKGTPRIYSYELSTKKIRTITGPGYLHPSYSPDGRYLVATKTNAFATDIVILNASNGTELLKLTSDGKSWAPVWSPAGNQVAFLHISGQVVDLRLIQLEGAGPSWTAKEPIDLTSNAGLDGISRPGWFIPADQLPKPSPAPSVAPSESASPSGS